MQLLLLSVFRYSEMLSQMITFNHFSCQFSYFSSCKQSQKGTYQIKIWMNQKMNQVSRIQMKQVLVLVQHFDFHTPSFAKKVGTSLLWAHKREWSDLTICKSSQNFLPLIFFPQLFFVPALEQQQMSKKELPQKMWSSLKYICFTCRAGRRSENLGGEASINDVAIICPPYWNRVNKSAKIWANTPCPRFRRPRPVAMIWISKQLGDISSCCLFCQKGCLIE